MAEKERQLQAQALIHSFQYRITVGFRDAGLPHDSSKASTFFQLNL